MSDFNGKRCHKIFGVTLMILMCVMEVIHSKATENMEDFRFVLPTIVGGTNAKIKDYPYQVSVRLRGSHVCGGSIISEKYIITAAHCIRAPATSYSVLAGSSKYEWGGIVVGVKKTFVNKNYNDETFDNDIAILLLTKELEFNEFVIPIELAEKDRIIAEGDDAFVTGWGAHYPGGKESEVLQIVRVPIVDLNKCRALYKEEHREVTDRMLCAGYSNGGQDACQGDSGGPLTSNHELIGISSWGVGCGRPDTPGVYTSIPKLRDYITEITGI